MEILSILHPFERYLREIAAELEAFYRDTQRGLTSRATLSRVCPLIDKMATQAGFEPAYSNYAVDDRLEAGGDTGPIIAARGFARQQ